MAGRRTLSQLSKWYLEQYLPLRKANTNDNIKKENLKKWLSSVISKQSVTSEDIEAMLITLYSEERHWEPLIVEALANQRMIEPIRTLRKLNLKDNGL